MEHPYAIAPEISHQIASLEWSGELLSHTLVGIAGFSLEHLGLVGGLQPPERAGVDTRSASLFDRHVMRC